MKIFFLGTSGSEGIPCPGCHCPSCEEARRQTVFRRQPSALLVFTERGEALLVDAGMDVTPLIDGLPLGGVLLTHWHADHFSGLARLSWHQAPLPIAAPTSPLAKAVIAPRGTLKSPRPFEPFRLAGLEITPFPLNHAGFPTYGYLLREEETDHRLAILWDTKGCPPESLSLFEKKATLALVDATYAPEVSAANHNNLEEAISLGLSLAEEVFLTHISHNNWPALLIETYLATHCPHEPVALAYDGLKHELAVSLKNSLSLWTTAVV